MTFFFFISFYSINSRMLIQEAESDCNFMLIYTHYFDPLSSSEYSILARMIALKI